MRFNMTDRTKEIMFLILFTAILVGLDIVLAIRILFIK